MKFEDWWAKGPAADWRHAMNPTPYEIAEMAFVAGRVDGVTQRPAKRSDQLSTDEMYDLDVACTLIRKAFEPPYLVGSSGIDGRHDYRDVDVRLMLSDEEFDAIIGENRYRWELLSLAIGDYLRLRSRLPVDFQIQRASEGNERHDKPRNPLGMGRNLAGGGDATPWTPKADPDTDLNEQLDAIAESERRALREGP